MADEVANSIIYNFAQIGSPLASDATWTTLNPELKKGQFVFVQIGGQIGLKIAENDGDHYNDLDFSFLGTSAPIPYEFNGSDVINGILSIDWDATKVANLGNKPSVISILLDGSTGDSLLTYAFDDYPIIAPTTLKIKGIPNGITTIYIKAQS